MSVSDLPPGEFSPGDQAELVRLGSLLTSKDLSTVTLERALDENSLVDRFVSRYAAWQTFSAPVPAGNRAAGPCAIMARDFALVFRLLIRNRVLRNMGVSVVCVKCVFFIIILFIYFRAKRQFRARNVVFYLYCLSFSRTPPPPLGYVGRAAIRRSVL
jgi:hypothetical protein